MSKSVLKKLLLVLTALLSSATVAEESKPLLLQAARVFDGNSFKTNVAVLVNDGKISQIAAPESFKNTNAQVINLGDATLLPGFIDLHTHIHFQHIPEQTILQHGITTVRDMGGIVHQPSGGDGHLRVMTAGLIITAPGGYPINKMGEADLAIPVTTEEQARQAVRNMVENGSVIIKIALEPGGETGAPWSAAHGHTVAHGHHHGEEKPTEKTDAENAHQHSHHDHEHGTHAGQAEWPMLSLELTKAIVDEAHKLRHKVSAHLSETKGATIALNAGVDEWAHLPCDPLPEALLKQAAAQKVKIVGTFDTLSKCHGLAHNAHTLAGLGVEFLYGSEIAHPDIPWGIDAQELIDMVTMAKMTPLQVLHTATAKAGEYLNRPLLGTIQADAPADLIAVKGNPLTSFKILEYPDFVMSGGKVIVNNLDGK